MKSTTQRDLYADALECFSAEVPIDQWPMTGSSLSRSGLERAMRLRGFVRFDRKRLLSSKCAPILKRMELMLASHLAEIAVKSGVSEEVPSSGGLMSTQAEKQFSRRIKDLERELNSATRREKAYREKCALLEAQIEAIRSRRDAFELHCETSLRTLHL